MPGFKNDDQRIIKNAVLSVRIFHPVMLFAFVLFTVSCNTNSNPLSHTDEIKTIQMGEQVWAATNLSVATFSNGDSIPQIRSAKEWEIAGKEQRPGWCYYDNDSTTAKTYGRLYNWFAVKDPKGLCPVGWHVPTNDEWTALEDYLGVPVAGLRLKCDTGWKNNGNGDNSNGFCLMPGGYRGRDGRFTGAGEFLYLTSSSEGRPEDPKDNKMCVWGRGIQFENKDAMRCLLDKEFGLYVRCIKNN
ncbi:MAG: fibrobacter succinogenes major paralogous domain-containing protein [Bacteroidota bacterium]